MRKIALIITIIGLGILMELLIKEPRVVNSIDEVDIGETVRLEGIVEQERKFGNGKILMIDEISVFCECKGSYSGKKVYVEGIIEKFPDDLRIRAFKIQILD